MPIDVGASTKVIVFMLLADAIWLSTMRPMYARLVKSVQGRDMAPLRIVPAIVAYVFVLFAFVSLCAARISKSSSGLDAFLIGCASGLAIYGIFNATNAAIFSGYTLVPAVADTLWGTALFGTASFLYHRFL
jgi:uncharacterized membrane protein